MTTNYLDPREDPHRWLRAILEELLEQSVEGNKDSKQLLKGILGTLSYRVETNFILDYFDSWIWPYVDLLEEHQNNQSNPDPKLIPKDPSESEE